MNDDKREDVLMHTAPRREYVEVRLVVDGVPALAGFDLPPLVLEAGDQVVVSVIRPREPKE